MDKFFYSLENGDYIFNGVDGKINMGKKISIAFSYHPYLGIPGTLHKHGMTDRVQQWYKETFRMFKRHNLPEAKELVLIDFEKDAPVEEINKMINITGYVGKWYEKYKEENNNA